MHPRHPDGDIVLVRCKPRQAFRNAFPKAPQVGGLRVALADHAIEYPAGFHACFERCQGAFLVGIEFGEYVAGSGAIKRAFRAVPHDMQGLHCDQVLRYLGCRRPEIFAGEVHSDSRRRQEGVRLKHWVNRNSLKMYDKGSILRVEATINDPSEFKVYRGPENDQNAPKRWRVLRRSTADTFRRAQVSQAATKRYLEAMSSVQPGSALGQQAQALCRPVRKGTKRYRALNPFAPGDARLLKAICAGEFLIHEIVFLGTFIGSAGLPLAALFRLVRSNPRFDPAG